VIFKVTLAELGNESNQGPELKDQLPRPEWHPVAYRYTLNAIDFKTQEEPQRRHHYGGHKNTTVSRKRAEV